MTEQKNAGLNAIELSSLISSRICHDLVNPVGALSSGLDVLNDPTMDDEAMTEAALDLVRQSAEKSVALLKFARLAYGVSGGRGAEIPLDEAREILQGIFAWSKADLDWRLPSVQTAKEIVKSLMILVQTASDCVPRGGVVSVFEAEGGFTIRAEGPRIFLNDTVAQALAGDAHELLPKNTPLYLAGLMCRERGGYVEATVLEGEAVVFRVENVALQALPGEALTAS
jgi:histidine phosphotransferase ChpT